MKNLFKFDELFHVEHVKFNSEEKEKAQCFTWNI